MSNLNDLEYRLWLLQGEVNQALQNAGRFDPAELERLNHIESEIRYLQQQTARLRGLRQEMPMPSAQPLSPERMPSAQPLPPGQMPSAQPLPPERMPSARPFPPGQMPSAQPIPPVQPMPSAQPIPGGYPLPFRQPPQPETSKGRDLEKTLGTGIMGIAASILIFISIIIFGGLLLPHLSDAAMTAIMFLLSFLLLGAGYFLLQKNPKNKFYISLCACGATAVCVSLFVTRLYFALINDGVFLGLTAVWLALMAYLCIKYKNYIFRIIGELGIFLVMCLGMDRLAAEDMGSGSWFMFGVLLFLFGGSAFIFDHIISRTSYEKNGFSHVIRTLVMILLAVFFPVETGSDIGVYAGFAFVSAFLVLEIYMSYKDDLHDGCLFYGLMSFDALMYCVILNRVFHLKSFLPYYIASILLAGFFELKKSKNSIFGNVVVCLLFVLNGRGWLHDSVFYALLVMLPLFLHGYVKKNAASLYIGLFCTIGIFRADAAVSDMLLLWVLPFVCFAVLARRTKDQVFTAAGYPVFMLCGAGLFWELTARFGLSAGERRILVFLAAAVLHMLIVRCRLLAEERIGFEITAAAMTVFLMLFSAYAVYQEYLNVLTMMVMAALFSMNTVNLLKKSENFGYYIGFKYTALMILLVDAHVRLSMLISVLMLLFAAGCIALGFYKSIRSFRIYGLILSMVSVFKLILFDVSGRSALYNALGFLVCGLICFGISFLYNKIESKVKKK